MTGGPDVDLPKAEDDKGLPAPKDLYQILINSRNLEIGLFWQRSNYFLLLNTGIAFGFFNLREPKYVWTFAVFGLLSSILWFWVCLGSKYWQSRWEQRLIDFEREKISAELAFFAADNERVRNDAEKGLSFNSLGPIQKKIYDLAKRIKPSVSYSMIRLAAMFVIGWGVLIAFLTIYGSPITD